MKGTWEGVVRRGIGLDGFLLHGAGGAGGAGRLQGLLVLLLMRQVLLMLKFVLLKLRLAQGLLPHKRAGGVHRVEIHSGRGGRSSCPEAVIEGQTLRERKRYRKGNELKKTKKTPLKPL